MQLISKFKNGFGFLLCSVDIYRRNAWVIPLNNKQGITITNAFQKTLVESNWKPNETWVHKGNE